MTQDEILDNMKTQAANDDTLSGVDTTSKTGVFGLVLYVVSFALASFWELLTTHKTEINNSIQNKQRHDILWYKAKALAFQLGDSLVTESDYYEVVDETKQIVKYAVAIQEADKSVVNIKIANENREPITASELTAFTAYMDDVLDLGVNINMINKAADSLKLELTIYYDAQILAADGSLITDSSTFLVNDAVFAYVQSIEFNSPYANVYLVDALQNVDGVKIPEVNSSKYKYDALTWQTIQALQVPSSGSFSLADDDLTINYVAL